MSIGKIGAFCADLKRLIHDTITFPTQKQPDAKSDQRSPYDREREPTPNAEPTVATAKMNPPISENSKTDESNQKRPKDGKLILEIIGLGVLIAYTTFAAFQWRAMLDSNKINGEL